MAVEKPIYSVNDVNRYIKAIITNDQNLKYIYVKGEISNFKEGANGHFYFSLKDKESIINVMMFNNYSKNNTFVPKNGDVVITLCSVDVYPARGSYQLIAYQMNLFGQGDILLELEQLKKKLAAEGLFDASRKKPINIYPHAVGVITAKNSAAIKDILFNLKRRYPIADIYVFYSSVQGENAPKELLKAFLKTQEYDLDTIIIGRGGGASEDLSAFNDEKLVRAISNSKIPVIAAVGHEIDSTLVDYVADKRASTPTGAAELATVDRREIEQFLDYALIDMKEAIGNKFKNLKEEINDYKKELSVSLINKIKYISQRLEAKKNELIALNPLKILERGYSLSIDGSGKIIKDLNIVKQGDKMTTITKNGKINSIVEEVIKS